MGRNTFTVKSYSQSGKSHSDSNTLSREVYRSEASNLPASLHQTEAGSLRHGN